MTSRLRKQNARFVKGRKLTDTRYYGMKLGIALIVVMQITAVLLAVGCGTIQPKENKKNIQSDQEKKTEGANENVLLNDLCTPDTLLYYYVDCGEIKLVKCFDIPENQKPFWVNSIGFKYEEIR